MKKKKFNLLLIDKEVASKSFACYFLDNCKIYLLNNKNKKNNDFFINFSFTQKNNINFDLVFIFSPIDYKMVEQLNKHTTLKTKIITNNFSVYALLKSNNIDITYINIELEEFDIENKIYLTANKDIDISSFSQKIEIKTDIDIVKTQLYNLVVNNAIESALYLNNNNFYKLLWQRKCRVHIINLIEEQTKIINNCLLDMFCKEKFDIYKFLSGKNIFSKIKRHLTLFLYLSNYKNQNINFQNLKNNIEKILQLNFGKYVEIRYLNKMFEMLK